MNRSVVIAGSSIVAFMSVLAAATFVYGRGFSYLSNRSEACNNCHVTTSAAGKVPPASLPIPEHKPPVGQIPPIVQIQDKVL